jgi:hypothetical protein
MGDAAADEHQSSGHDVGTNYSAGDACQQTAEQRALKECIL